MITKLYEKSIDKLNALSILHPQNEDAHLTLTTKSNASIKAVQLNPNMKTKSVLKELNGGIVYDSFGSTKSVKGNKTTSTDTSIIFTTKLSTLNRSSSIHEYLSEQTFSLATISTFAIVTEVTYVTKQYPIRNLRNSMKGI